MATATPLMVLPSSMQSKGMAYCGAYQGSLPITTVSARKVTVNEERNMAPEPISQP